MKTSKNILKKALIVVLIIALIIMGIISYLDSTHKENKRRLPLTEEEIPGHFFNK
jgi:hypothetical protein